MLFINYFDNRIQYMNLAYPPRLNIPNNHKKDTSTKPKGNNFHDLGY